MGRRPPAGPRRLSASHLCRRRKTTRQFRHYAGSPLLALDALRNSDRVVLVEQLPMEARALERALPRRRGVSVISGDGYAALKAYLPPKENRGLVLIDPPYEAEDEFAAVERALEFGLERWPTGVFAAWYPIKAGGESRRLHASLQASGLRKLLLLDFHLRPADSPIGVERLGPGDRQSALASSTSRCAKRWTNCCDCCRRQDGSVRIEWLVGE